MLIIVLFLEKNHSTDYFIQILELMILQQRGIIGTLRPNGFEWSETRGLEVTAIGSGFDSNGIRTILSW